MASSAYGGDSYDLTPGYRGGGGRTASGAGSIVFAGTILGLIGVSNVIDGAAALSGSKVYPKTTVFEFGDLRLWGFVVLIVGVLAIAASFAIFTKSRIARTFGIVVASGNAFAQLLLVPAQPWWALAAFAADILVVRALVTHGGRDLLVD